MKISKILSAWFGDFGQEELKKFILLGIIFAFMIGINWIFRILKDSAFTATTGWQFSPYAKTLSFLISIPLVAFYGILLDRFNRKVLFYLICLFYALGTAIFAYFLTDSCYGVSNTVCSPWRVIGWSWYIFVESFVSVIMAFFWAFVADSTTPDSARRGY